MSASKKKDGQAVWGAIRCGKSNTVVIILPHCVVNCAVCVGSATARRLKAKKKMKIWSAGTERLNHSPIDREGTHH